MIMLASPVVMKRIEIEHPFPIGKRWLLIWRGIIAASYMIINYYAIQVRKQKSYKNISFKAVSDLETCMDYFLPPGRNGGNLNFCCRTADQLSYVS